MKLNAAAVRKITSDWSSVYPEFTVWKPLRLMRRLGPIVQGITLDRSTYGDSYYPHAHVHALTRDFPDISLTLTQRLEKPSGVPEGIPVDRHDEKFMQSADRLKAQSSLSCEEAPALEQLVQRYWGYATDVQRGRIPNAIIELEDCVLVPAVVGNEELARESMQVVTRVAAGWSRAESPWGWDSTSDWLDWLTRRMLDVEGLAATVEEQILKHKLSNVRTLQLQ